jgi:deoxyribonuclease V
MLRSRPELVHPWRVSLAEARAIQRRLASHVRLEPLPAEGGGAPCLAAGVDLAYELSGERAWAAAVVMDERLHVVERRVVCGEPDMPYVRGYLGFREGRLALAALEALEHVPDVVFLDGHGVVHERGLGLASHIGVMLDVPTVGVPKTPFHSIDHQPAEERGSYYVLTKEWGATGASIRLRSGSKAVYVSPGHRTDLDSAIALALRWSTGRHRVPEPLQAAHTLSRLALGGEVPCDAEV